MLPTNGQGEAGLNDAASSVKKFVPPSSSTLLPVLPALYGLSGFLSLGYQAVWFRVFTDRFGSTNLTFLLVLVTFIAGLGVGALMSDGLISRMRGRFPRASLLNFYGLVEILIASSLLLTVAVDLWPGGLLPGERYRALGGVHWLTPVAVGAEVAMGAVCVLLPSVLMGATFPMLCRARGDDGRYPAMLYAWNTFGAVLGVVVCQLTLFPSVGYRWTLFGLVFANALLGLLFLLSRPDHCSDSRSGGFARPRVSHEPRAAVSEVMSSETLIVLGLVGGLLAGAAEGDLLKRLWFVGASSTHALSFISLWAVLGIFLASVTVRAVPLLSLWHVKLALGLSVLVHVVLWKAAYPIRNWLQAATASAEASSSEAGGWASALPFSVQVHPVELLVFIGLFVFPVIYLGALALPWACNAAQRAGRGVAPIYGANTLAFCIGLVVFSWLAPRSSFFYSAKLAPAIMAIGAALVLLLPKQGRVPRWSLGAAGVAIAVASLTTPAGIDRELLDPDRRPYHFPARALKSNGAHTSYVVSTPEGDHLYFDGHPMSSTAHPAQVYMRLMAHWPLLAQRQPRSALVVGYGVGNTVSAVVGHTSIRQVDVVELNHRVIETAPEFAETTGAVHLDPRVRFFHDDGRSFLRATGNRYDLITSEPPPPNLDGVYRLYSLDYYRDAKMRLTSEGMVSQWLPVAQLSRRSMNLIIRTFTTAFPHAVLLSGYGSDMILVGSPHPFLLEGLAERLASRSEVAADLARLGVPDSDHLLARVIQAGAVLASSPGSGPVIRDHRNPLAHRSGPVGAAPTLSFDAAAIMAALSGWGGTDMGSLEALLTDTGRLRYRLRPYPLEFLRVAGREAGNWPQVIRLERVAARAARDGQVDVALASIRAALALAPDDPLLLLNQSKLEISAGRPREAVRALEAFVTREPAAPAGWIRLAQAHMAAGNDVNALAAAGKTRLLAPDEPAAYRVEAEALLLSERPLEALERLDTALALGPHDLDTLKLQGAVLACLRAGAASADCVRARVGLQRVRVQGGDRTSATN